MPDPNFSCRHEPNRKLVMMTGLALVTVLAMTCIAVAESYREIRDWSVSCTNDLACVAASMQEIPGVYAVGFQRSAKADAALAFYINSDFGPKAGSAIRLSVPGEVGEYQIKVDEAPEVAGVWRFERVDMIERLVPGLKAGQTLFVQLETEKGTREFSLSLSGMTGAFLNMDDVQQRLQRTDALEAVGNKPAADAVSRVSDLDSTASLPAGVISEWTRPANACDDDYSDEPRDLVADFGGTRVQLSDTDALFILPCGGPGAYNLIQIVIGYSSENEMVRTYSMPVLAPSGLSVMKRLTNPVWNERKSQLSHFEKARGLGDCGSAATWKLDSDTIHSEFVLVEQREKNDCDGKYDDEWPLVWPPG